MSVETSLEVKGLKASIDALKRANPQVRRDLTKGVKGAAEPLIMAARGRVPNSPPLSRMTDGKYAWTKKAQSGITTKVGGRSRGNAYTIISVIQKDGPGSIFDMAGKANNPTTAGGRAFIANLSRRFGAPSRSMWPAAEEALPAVIQAVRIAVDESLAEINRKIVEA